MIKIKKYAILYCNKKSVFIIEDRKMYILALNKYSDIHNTNQYKNKILGGNNNGNTTYRSK